MKVQPNEAAGLHRHWFAQVRPFSSLSEPQLDARRVRHDWHSKAPTKTQTAVARMPLPSHAVIALVICLPVLTIICTYIVCWYRSRRKNNELEQGPGDDIHWDYWLNPGSNGSDGMM